jgi:membrane protein CcdC involved in cytochrome C biogenesis
VIAFVLGATLLAYPMLKTSRLVREGDTIFLKRSRAFLGILLGLIAIRFGAREYVGQYVDAIQTGSIFFVLAFGMIVRWRTLMYLEYKKLRASTEQVAIRPLG